MAMPVASPDMDRWREEALALPTGEAIHTVPLNILLDEAEEAAEFHKRRWKNASAGGVPRFGLESVAGKGVGRMLHERFDEELLSLRRATEAANTNYSLVSQTAESPEERGRFLLRELRGAVEFYVDDGESDEAAAHVAALARDHATDPAALPDLAAALEAYAALAELHRDALEGLGGFSAASIEEARAVASELRKRPRTPRAHTGESREALELRNRYAALLVRRLTAIRAAAAFVFRDHPAIARDVTSSYERRKRAATRRAAADAAEPAEPEAEPAFE